MRSGSSSHSDETREPRAILMDSLAGCAEGVRAPEQIQALIKPLTQCLVKSYLSNEIQLPEI